MGSEPHFRALFLVVNTLPAFQRRPGPHGAVIAFGRHVFGSVTTTTIATTHAPAHPMDSDAHLHRRPPPLLSLPPFTSPPSHYLPSPPLLSPFKPTLQDAIRMTADLPGRKQVLSPECWKTASRRRTGPGGGRARPSTTARRHTRLSLDPRASEAAGDTTRQRIFSGRRSFGRLAPSLAPVADHRRLVLRPPLAALAQCLPSRTALPPFPARAALLAPALPHFKTLGSRSARPPPPHPRQGFPSANRGLGRTCCPTRTEPQSEPHQLPPRTPPPPPFSPNHSHSGKQKTERFTPPQGLRTNVATAQIDTGAAATSGFDGLLDGVGTRGKARRKAREVPVDGVHGNDQESVGARRQASVMAGGGFPSQRIPNRWLASLAPGHEAADVSKRTGLLHVARKPLVLVTPSPASPLSSITEHCNPIRGARRSLVGPFAGRWISQGPCGFFRSTGLAAHHKRARSHSGFHGHTTLFIITSHKTADFGSLSALARKTLVSPPSDTSGEGGYRACNLA
ncbi:hypothetical protein C7M84_009654 [Penaeus vannamei]|uniref:Uncharacterized protein n=1 Tax=Penaeus vannamei TaxID=6689 RepID=A0A3R7QMA0_PENVA|nr:hypothetical protein C7M84_009654 [Penaeus vannamei]